MAEKHKSSPIPDRPTKPEIERSKAGEPEAAQKPATKGERVWMTGTASPSMKKSSETTES